MTWAQNELKTIDMGDKRLNDRGATLLDQFFNKPSLSIPGSCHSWKETCAAYRFFSNSNVTTAKILEPHISSTLERVKEYETVLAIQDTTEMDFSSMPETQGLGPLSYENQIGFHLHPTLITTPNRIPLGVIDAYFWSRDPETFGVKRNRKAIPIEDKESMRWINGYREVCCFSQGVKDTEVIYLADREADIYELFIEREKILEENAHAVDFIIRSNHNRTLANGSKLKDAFENAKDLGEIQFELPPREGKKSQIVTQQVKAIQIELKAPKKTGKNLPNVIINAVYSYEENPPSGEEPVKWILLTSKAISSFEEAIKIISYYLCRWDIEIFFKVLKSGCAVEKLQLEQCDRLGKAITLFMIVAWRVMFLMKLGRECPNLPCTVVFEDQEWQSVYIVIKKSKPPNDAPPINEMIRMVARLGGYLDRKNDGPAGVKTMWIGLQRARDFTIAIQANNEIKKE